MEEEEEEMGCRTPKLSPIQSQAEPRPVSLERDVTRTSLPAKSSPDPDDVGPIVRRPMGLLVAAS